MEEFYEDLWVEKRQLEAIEQENGKLEKYDRERLKYVCALLDITDYVSDDPLFDKWERELAAGLTPDLNEGLPDG